MGWLLLRIWGYCIHIWIQISIFIVTDIYTGHAPTEVKNVIMFYPSITQTTVDSHCEILWDENPGEKIGCHPTKHYSASLYDAEKQSIFAHQCLRSKMLSLFIKNSLTTDANRKLRVFKSTYTFNAQYDGAVMFFVIVNMVWHDTRARCSDIKYKLVNIKMSHFKHDIPKSNL